MYSQKSVLLVTLITLFSKVDSIGVCDHFTIDNCNQDEDGLIWQTDLVNMNETVKLILY